jgi:hypothetical protein
MNLAIRINRDINFKLISAGVGVDQAPSKIT